MFRAEFPQLRKKERRRDDDPRIPLDRLDNDGRYLVMWENSLEVAAFDLLPTELLTGRIVSAKGAAIAVRKWDMIYFREERSHLPAHVGGDSRKG